MIRHTFIASIKEDANEQVLEKVMQDMRDLKKSVPQIKSIVVGKALGYLGANNVITMTVDLESKEDFDIFVASEPHQAVSAKAAQVFELDSFVINQIAF